MSMRPGRIFQFGEFQIDALTRTLRREEAIVKLNSRAFDVLLYLVQNPGKVIARDELLKNVWRDACVDESSLAQNISLLRRALEEKPGDNSYIVTLPGRGYQFASAVQIVAPEVASEDGNTPSDVAATGRSDSSGIIFQKHTVETSVITTNEEKEQLSSPISKSRPLIGMLTAVAAVVVTVVAVVLVVRFRTPRSPEPKHELVERQLTANPPENSISSQAISRDGKYLAYSDFLSKNLYLLAIDSGEIRRLPLPARYVPVDWFPDGNHLLLVNAAGDLWKMSTWDSGLRKLWADHVTDVALSPDGSHIAFLKDEGEGWLMGADGEEPHKILADDAQEALRSVAWSPTGQRLAYIRFQGPFAKRRVTLETCDLTGGARTVVLSDPYLFGWPTETGIAWLPDGRIIYLIYSKEKENESNLWAIGADPSTGQRRGDAALLAGWKNSLVWLPRASGDGKRLIAARQHVEEPIYLGDLTFGNKRFTPQRFTPDDWYNAADDWTKDSKGILFHSKRNGKWAIFKQNIDAKAPETLIAGSENYFDPRLSAQGTLLYSATAFPNNYEPGDTTIRLMSTPEQGGARSTLMTGKHNYACGSSPSSSCVVSDLKDRQLIFSHLDPVKGKGEEIARLGYHQANPAWDLSPDGSRIAIVDETEDKGEIHILNLADRKFTVLTVRDWKWSYLSRVRWAADGKSWFVFAQGPLLSLLSVDANGTPRVLQEMPWMGYFPYIAPSPDGKRIAFTKRMFVSDVMLLENF